VFKDQNVIGFDVSVCDVLGVSKEKGLEGVRKEGAEGVKGGRLLEEEVEQGSL